MNERLWDVLIQNSKNKHIRQYAETVKELYEYMQGRTPLGFLSWLRWISFYLPFRAAMNDDISMSWWQWLLISIGLFIGLSIVSRIYRPIKSEC